MACFFIMFSMFGCKGRTENQAAKKNPNPKPGHWSIAWKKLCPFVSKLFFLCICWPVFIRPKLTANSALLKIYDGMLSLRLSEGTSSHTASDAAFLTRRQRQWFKRCWYLTKAVRQRDRCLKPHLCLLHTPQQLFKMAKIRHLIILGTGSCHFCLILCKIPLIILLLAFSLLLPVISAI